MLGLTRAEDEAREERLVRGRERAAEMTTAQQSAERASRTRGRCARRSATSSTVAAASRAARRQLDVRHRRTTSRPGGCSAGRWAWPASASPEDMGGAGGGLAELTVVAEELGRALLPVPFLSSTVLAGQILARCPDTAATCWVSWPAGDVLGRLRRRGRRRLLASRPPARAGRERRADRGGCPAGRVRPRRRRPPHQLVVAAEHAGWLRPVPRCRRRFERAAPRAGDAGSDPRTGRGQLRRRHRRPR